MTSKIIHSCNAYRIYLTLKFVSKIAHLARHAICGECQITAIYMSHTWCKWLDGSPTSVSAATPPLTRNCYANARPDASVVHVFWRLAQAASVAGWPRPRPYTKEALFKPEPAALRAAATVEAITQRETPHYTRVPSEQERLWDFGTFMFSTQRQICLDGSAFKIPFRIHSFQHKMPLF